MPAERAGRPPWLRTALGVGYALLLTACASAQIAYLRKAGADTACITPATLQDTIVGVSFSGVGDRQAGWRLGASINKGWAES